MREVIKDLGERHTVILSSHILHEVSAVCDKIIIINDGKIVVQKKTNEFEDTSNGFFTVRFKSVKKAEEILCIFKDFQPSFEGSKESGTFDFSMCLMPENADLRETVFNIASDEKIPILMIKPITFSLEEIFIKVINNTYDNTYDKNLETTLEDSDENDRREQ